MWSPTVLVSVGVWEGEDLTGSLWCASGFVLLVAWLSSCLEFRSSLRPGPPEAPITAGTEVQFSLLPYESQLDVFLQKILFLASLSQICGGRVHR